MYSIQAIRDNLINFYKSSSKPTFWFSLVILSQLIGFIPRVPSFITYALFILFSFYQIVQSKLTVNKSLVAFIIYIPLQLIILQPNPIFRSWERFTLFVILLICVSPLIRGESSNRRFSTLFKMILIICTIVGVGSFFAKFMGVNYMIYYGHVWMDRVGFYGGLTTHSMVLGLVSGIGTVYCAYLGWTRNSFIFYILSLISIVSVFFSASRSALLSTVGGFSILIYLLSSFKSKFLKIFLGIIIIGLVSFPLWEGITEGVMEKNSRNIESGGSYSSRARLWQNLANEFKHSPFFGVGFDAADMDLIPESSNIDENNGMIESGSSWLMILAMTGIIGFLLIVPMMANIYYNAFRNGFEYSALICGVLTVLFIHMMAEGYIFYGGSIQAFILWSVLGVGYNYNIEVKNNESL